MADGTAVSPEDARSFVLRILESREFRRSERLCRFLRFTVDRTLAGAAATLKEYVLATEVFDRGASYDPRVDTIVRVEARRLRKKLQAYYQGEGASDTVVVAFQEGSYVPAFRRVLSPPEGDPGPTAPRTVAVLPFANLSPEPDQAFFCDGVTEEVIHALATLPGLNVVARTSAFLFRESAFDVREIGSRLGAQLVVEGSVRKAGDRLRVTAQVVDAATGFPAWSKVFDRVVDDVFAIQEEIARAVVGALRVGLGPARTSQLATRHAADIDAYTLYLRARHRWHELTPEGFHAAIGLYERLIAEHPRYTLGYVGLGDTYGLLSYYGLLPPHEGMGRARALSLRALELDDELGELYCSLGGLFSFYDFDWPRAEASFERALELAPGNALAHQWFGVHLLARRRFDEALVHLDRARLLDPLSPDVLVGQAMAGYARRDFAAARAFSQKALELVPGYHDAWFCLAETALAEGRFEEAAAAIEEIPEARRIDLHRGTLAEAWASAGRRSEAEDALSRLSALPAAWVHLGLGNADAALHALGQAWEEHASRLAWLATDPRYDLLRGDARFTFLLHRVGLAE